MAGSQAGAEAVSDVDSGGSKSVALRAPLAVDLVVRDGDKDLAKLDKVEFKRLAGVTIVVTGDITQVDLPGGTTSGLRAVTEILQDIDDVAFCRLTSHDVVRHKLVGKIVDAYERHDAKQGS